VKSSLNITLCKTLFIEVQKSKGHQHNSLTIAGSFDHLGPTVLNGSGNAVKQFIGNEADTGSGSESTDSLLEEAREYLKVAKTKLVTIEDWGKIDEEKKMKKKLKKRVKHSPTAVSFCKYCSAYNNLTDRHFLVMTV